MMDDTGNLGFLAKLSPEERNSLFHHIDERIRVSFQTNILLNRLAVESSRSEAVNEALASVTAKTGASQEESLLFALTLYEVAIDAMAQGQRLVLVDKDYGFVREVTGLVRKPPETPLPDKVAG